MGDLSMATLGGFINTTMGGVIVIINQYTHSGKDTSIHSLEKLSFIRILYMIDPCLLVGNNALSPLKGALFLSISTMSYPILIYSHTC